ncbi:MAG: T9SS type A sorting domain-containing protein, partial [Bacteroidota bacterium]
AAAVPNATSGNYGIPIRPATSLVLTGPNSTGNVYTTQAGKTAYVWTVSAGGSVTGGGTSTSNTVTVSWTTSGARSVSVSYTNELGCTSAIPGNYDVTVNPLPAAQAGADRSICLNSSTTLGAAAVPGNTYSWTSIPAGFISSFANPTVSPLVTTTYTLVETSGIGVASNGCTNSHSVVVTVNPLPVPTLTGPTSVCNNSAGNTYTTEASMTNYLWTIPAGATITAGGTALSNTVTLTFTTAGAKIIKVNYTNANGCTAATPKQLTVTVNPTSAPAIFGSNMCCANANTIFSTTAFQTNYVWTVSAGGTIVSGQGTKTATVKWANAGANWVGVNYTNVNGCSAATAAIKNVTVNPLPVPTLTGPASVCVNSTGNVYTTQAGMSGYVWTVSAGGTITAGGTSASNSVTVTWTTAGSKTVSVSYANGLGCAAASPTSFYVTVNPLPVPTLNGPTPVCNYSGGNTYTTEAQMSNYQWTIPTGATVTAGGSSSDNTVTITWNTAGAKIIKVNYSDASGCSAATPRQLTVAVNPSPIPLLTGSSVCCANVNTTYSTTAFQSNYVWTISSGGTIVSGQGTKLVVVRWAIAGANWIGVNYTNVNGCPAPSPTVKNVTVNPLPVPTLSGPSVVCANSTGNVYTTEAGMTGYSWNVSAGGTITAGGTSASNSVTITWASAGTRTVSVSYSNNFGCTAAQPGSYIVTVNPLPAADAGPDRSICINSSTTLGAPAVVGSFYSWTSVPAGFTSALANPVVTPLVTTTYTLVETTSIGAVALGCSNSHSVVVTVNPLPVITLSGPISICNNSVGNVYTTEAGMTNYEWTIPGGGTVTSGGSSSDNTVTITWTIAGAKVVTVNYTNANGCTAARAKQLTVLVNPTPVPIISGSSSCNVNTNTIYSTAAFQSNYVWTISAGGSIVSGQGTKTVTAKWTVAGANWIGVNYTNVNGCSAATPTIKNVTVNSNKSYVIEPDSSVNTTTINPINRGPVNVGLNVYPNPNDGYFTAIITLPEPATYDLFVFSNLGMKVYEKKDIHVSGTVKQKIDIRNMASGVYTLVLTNKDQTLRKSVVIKR